MRAATGVLIALALAPAALAAQREPLPLGRAQAVEAALARGARLAIARADTAAARAQLLGARALPNPTLATSYSRDIPRYHVALELPLYLPGLRSARVRSAVAGREAALYRFELERALVALEADTAYTRALAARAHADLSRRNARAADSLRRMAAARRDAGDASDLDVELATVNAGQQANVAVADSLALIATLLDLQTVIGLAGDRVLVTLTDSLAPPGDIPLDGAGDGTAPGDGGATAAAAPVAMPLRVAAAEASLAAARLAALAQHRSLFAAPSLTAGFDAGDPTGEERGLLPTFGIAIPLPLLDRNRGAIAEAEAARVRAEAELALARLESRNRITRATREWEIARERVARDRRLTASAERVAAMSLTAYREGAAPLASVLEAQRNARDVLAQYVDDVAAAWVAGATLRALTLTPTAATR
ncbi:MAG TPA: TolC family protein [Gemmatimonadaceae bacterium]|nr:TolC family protein [Gemmatimonadaceae bacterium]